MRYPSLFLGIEEAAFFGFRSFINNRFELPDFKEVNGAIKSFNKGLSINDPEWMDISYYEIPGIFNKNSEFVYGFVKSRSIPGSVKGRGFTHDITGHSLQGFFINNEVPRVLQKRIKTWQRFFEQIQSQGVNIDLEKIRKKSNKRLVNTIDDLANLGFMLSFNKDKLYLNEVGRQRPISDVEGEHTQILGYPIVTINELDEKRLRLFMRNDLDVVFYLFISSLEINPEDKAVLKELSLSFLEKEKEITPSSFEGLSFDFESAHEEVVRIKKEAIANGLGREDYRKELEKNPLTRDYFLRLKRLNTLVNKRKK